MKFRRGILTLLVVALSAFTLAPMSAAAAAPSAPSAASPAQNIPVTGTFPASPGGTFAGTLNINRFAVQNGQLVALGTLSGTVNSAGAVLGTVTNVPVTLPVAATGTCQILHLTLGPLDLNLLGLVVHLNQVVLDISAQPGAGNLLGNLLCSIANLLNGGGPLSQLVNALNQLLASL